MAWLAGYVSILILFTDKASVFTMLKTEALLAVVRVI